MKMLKSLIWFTCIICGTMVQPYVFNAQAKTATVLVGGVNLVFTPAVTNIALHDTVIWNWAGLCHSTTSGTNGLPSGLWDSGINNQPFSFTNTFNTAGTFSYFCSVHFSCGMTGAVVVAGTKLPPMVTITNPANGSVLSAPASFTLAASVVPGGGTVTNVQFLQGGTVLSNVPAAPYSIPVHNLPAASYTFSAIASDNAGLSATNSVSIQVVAAGPITLSSPVFSSPNRFQFLYSATTGMTYVVQSSSNLLNWNSRSTNTATINPVTYIDTNAPGRGAFYRVGLLPNP